MAHSFGGVVLVHRSVWPHLFASTASRIRPI